MLVVRRDDDAALVIGVRRTDEIAGLILLGIGLLTISFLIYLFSEFDFRRLLDEAPIQFVLYGLAFGFVGFVVLFLQQHFVMDRHQKILVHARTFRGERHWAFDRIEKVLVIQSSDRFGYCLIVFKGGGDLEIDRGPIQHCNMLAFHCAKAAEAPLEKEVRQKYYRKR